MSFLRLVKKEENTNQQLVEQNNFKSEIVQSILTGECSLPEEIANKFNLKYDNVISIISDPAFTNLLVQASQVKLKLSFYGKDLKRLDDIIKSEDDKVAIQGIKLKSQMVGAVKNISINETNNFVFNLENAVKEMEKQVNPVLNADYERK